ncbi:DNA-3-methyladenine glycosylase I [soil metagenome]
MPEKKKIEKVPLKAKQPFINEGNGDDKLRCSWSRSTPNLIKYHDTEWGVPVHDDRKLFEFMILDAFQAGLSWSTILNKRENFRNAFDNFEAAKISRYTDKKIEKLINDAGIIRNKMKINASVSNAKAFLKVQKEYGTFDKFIWQFTGGKTLYKDRKTAKDIPAKTIESDQMSKALIEKGFKFVGSTICYAFMQAAGMVHDHTTDCFRYYKNL